jgi:hypothetical protein
MFSRRALLVRCGVGFYVLKKSACCRSVCHIEAETHSENITLVNVLRARCAES